jgi:hypothetical protein
MLSCSISALCAMMAKASGPRCSEFLSQGHDRKKPRLVSYDSCDVALARQIFREQHTPRANPLDRPIADLDFGLTRERDRILPSGGAMPL